MKFDSTGLLEPQKEHARVLANSLVINGIAWDGSTMGAGKTFTGSSLARFMQQTDTKRVVVICPKKVKTKWHNTLKSFGVTPYLVENFEKLVRGGTKWLKYRRPTQQERAEDIERMMLIVLKFPKDCFIIVDESHRCNGVTSLQAGMLMALKRQGYKFLMASATQATSPLNMRAFGYVVGLHDGSMKEYKKFCINAGAEWKGHHGAMSFDNTDEKAKAKMADVHDYLFNLRKIGSRLRKTDFKGIFKKNQIMADAYDMGENSKKIQAAYDEMDYELDRLEEHCEGYANHVLAILIKARRKVEMLKVPTLCDDALESFENGHSPIVFVNFTDTILAIQARLSKEIGEHMIGMIYGGASNKDQMLALEEFQQDKRRAIIANIASGGESVDMHDLRGEFPRDAIINPSWNATKVIQASARHDRAHAQSDCITKYVFADGTCEVPICHRFQARKDNLDMLNDGDLVPSQRIFNLAAGKNI